MHTDAQSDVKAQNRTTKTKREEQHDVVHCSGNDQMGIDQSTGLLLINIHVREVVKIVPIRRPTDSGKPFQEPEPVWVLGDGAR